MRVDNPDNLDFEAYINNYRGRTRIDRALFIAQHCPSLAIDAYQSALHDIQNLTRDVKQYRTSLGKLNALLEEQQQEPITEDQQWIAQIENENKPLLEQLEAELKHHKSNLSKENIRLTHVKLGDYYYNIGDYANALKNYVRTRDYCTTSQHLLDMCLNAIKVNITDGHFSHVQTYVARAEATPNLPDKAINLAKLKCCQGLVTLTGTDPNKYRLVANALTDITFEAADAFNDVMSPNDIPIYGGLCALASYNRRELHALFQKNPSFKSYLELEPHIRNMMEAFYDAKYNVCLRLLADYRNDLLLDMYLHPLVDTLIQQIRERAMIQYCLPYSTVDMHQMATAFHINVSQLEKELVTLISHGDKIPARIDTHKKILCAKRKEQRTQAFDQSLQIGTEYEKAAKGLMLRLHLLKADMIVK
ncbi:26S proteasome subunit RPN7-domain-containing protein [Radiomyces spectabilis]|uniref:26S proteasome subunit RPN7-domain-containing protein n=1 Tax=Radiomyces spectabilis TaxID=64574 RepID=UPI00221EE34E|nr:26S proteasome subunit RPN7-domain-containing protein [Radiomyces spectabilis]KAI8368221.1 26S proteasome subunit RPN7-domain-containing protein [Radiomyces spectabilis]